MWTIRFGTRLTFQFIAMETEFDGVRIDYVYINKKDMILYIVEPVTIIAFIQSKRDRKKEMGLFRGVFCERAKDFRWILCYKRVRLVD